MLKLMVVVDDGYTHLYPPEKLRRIGRDLIGVVKVALSISDEKEINFENAEASCAGGALFKIKLSDDGRTSYRALSKDEEKRLAARLISKAREWVHPVLSVSSEVNLSGGSVLDFQPEQGC
jgi:hypothetical protein